MNRITVKMVAPRTVGASPETRLDGTFNAYRDACSAGGARWDAGSRHNVTDLDTVPRLVSSLEGAGFTVTLADDVRSEMIRRAAELQAVRHGADAATRAMNERLAPRGLTLYPFQGEGVTFLRVTLEAGATRTAALLADDMGLGKTIQALTASEVTGADGKARPLLVVCPAVAVGVWSREAAKWRPDLTSVPLEGRGSFRWPAPGEMVSINYEILSDTLPGAPAPGTIVILDEAQKIKNPKTDMARRVALIRDAVLPAAGVMWALTATPFENDGAEVLGICDAIGAKDVIAAMKGAALARWLAANKPAAFAGFLAPVTLRREKRTVLKELPPKRRVDEVVDISAESAAALDAITAEAGGLDALFGTVASATDEALRSADELPDFTALSRARAVLATAKIPALISIIEEMEEKSEPVIVMCDHLAPLEALATRPGWGKISGAESARKRTKLEEAFQRGELKGLACSIKAAGVALTLTRARLMIFVDRAWNPSKNDQAEDRIYRIGQMRECVILRLVARHAIDERVAEVCAGKEDVREKAVNVLSVADSAAPVTETLATMQALAARENPAPPPAPVAPAAEARPAFVPAGARLFPRNKIRARCVVCALMVEAGAGLSWLHGGSWFSAHKPGDDACCPPLVVVKPTGERFEAPERVSRAFKGGNAGGAPGARAHKDVARRGPATSREEWAARAMAHLAEMDPDRCREKNDVGFNAPDSPAGHALNYLIATGGLTDEAWGLAVSIAMHYRNTQAGQPPE